MGLVVRLNWAASSLVALATGAIGCGCEPPLIDGGTDVTRSSIQRALDGFFAAVPGGEVCVEEVRVEEVVGAAGTYTSSTRVIRVEETAIEPAAVARDAFVWSVAIHELCHAADHQMPVDLSDDELWWIVDDRFVRGHVRGEAFAYTCEVGPEAIQLIGEACPEDTSGAAAFQVVLDDVFTVPLPQVGTVELDWHEVASAEFPGAEVIGLAVVAAEDGAFRLDLRDGSRSQYLDLATGEPRPLTPKAEPAPVPEPLEGLVIDAVAPLGEGELLAVHATAYNGGLARRLVHRHQAGVASPGCPRPGEAVFAMDGTAWSVYGDGDTAVWGYWTER
jgi:hypothetical protein